MVVNAAGRQTPPTLQQKSAVQPAQNKIQGAPKGARLDGVQITGIDFGERPAEDFGIKFLPEQTVKYENRFTPFGQGPVSDKAMALASMMTDTPVGIMLPLVTGFREEDIAKIGGTIGAKIDEAYAAGEISEQEYNALNEGLGAYTDHLTTTSERKTAMLHVLRQNALAQDKMLKTPGATQEMYDEMVAQQRENQQQRVEAFLKENRYDRDLIAQMMQKIRAGGAAADKKNAGKTESGAPAGREPLEAFTEKPFRKNEFVSFADGGVSDKAMDLAYQMSYPPAGVKFTEQGIDLDDAANLCGEIGRQIDKAYAAGEITEQEYNDLNKGLAAYSDHMVGKKELWQAGRALFGENAAALEQRAQSGASPEAMDAEAERLRGSMQQRLEEFIKDNSYNRDMILQMIEKIRAGGAGSVSKQA